MVRLKEMCRPAASIWLVSFNSTMVRLKDDGPKSHHQSVVCFNSTMVRLKAAASHSARVLAVLFQFHYGTIKRFPESIVKAQCLFCFNSTMVRLKVSACSLNLVFCPCFNSTMVRLKGDSGPHSSDKFSFQFHYGTIKR